jgi:hypothetical protein
MQVQKTGLAPKIGMQQALGICSQHEKELPKKRTRQILDTAARLDSNLPRQTTGTNAEFAGMCTVESTKG